MKKLLPLARKTLAHGAIVFLRLRQSLVKRSDFFSVARKAAYTKSLAVCAIGLWLNACSTGNKSQDTADDFCHRYFVEMNQAHALELADGLAAEKLRKEIALLKGAARAFEGGEREFHQLKPFTDFVMLDRDPETDDGAEKVLYIYEIRIESRHDTSTMKRAFVINTVKENGRWRVSNFDLEAR